MAKTFKTSSRRSSDNLVESLLAAKPVKAPSQRPVGSGSNLSARDKSFTNGGHTFGPGIADVHFKRDLEPGERSRKMPPDNTWKSWPISKRELVWAMKKALAIGGYNPETILDCEWGHIADGAMEHYATPEPTKGSYPKTRIRK